MNMQFFFKEIEDIKGNMLLGKELVEIIGKASLTGCAVVSNSNVFAFDSNLS